MPATRRGRGARAARAGVGGAPRRLAGRAGATPYGSRSPRRGYCGRRRERFDAVIVGYPGHFDLPAAPPSRTGRAGRLQPARLARGHLRRRPRPLPAGLDRGESARARRPASLPRGRSRRLRHAGARRPPRGARRARPGARRRLLRRRRGAALPARLGAAGAVHVPVRRQADPAPRPGDDPRRGTTRAGDPVPRRRLGQLDALLADAACERRARAVGRVRATARTSSTAPAARSASSARRRRRRG